MTTADLALSEPQARILDEPLPVQYELWTAAEKMVLLWDQRLVATEYPTLPPYEARPLSLAKHYLEQSFTYASDQFPPGHTRALHLRGSVARAVWQPVPHVPYTGLFMGVEHALIRLSLGTAPRWPAGFVPGLAIKLLVDRAPSANLHVMNSVDGQGDDHDIFARAFSNQIPPARGWLTWLGALAFRRVKADPYHLPVDHLARVTEDGHAVDRPRWPHQLHFLPGEAVRNRCAHEPHDFRHDLARIPEGTTLYEIHASATADAAPEPIARLVTRSRFVSSWWGDERLFFQHNR
jgi:hypothetical protein